MRKSQCKQWTAARPSWRFFAGLCMAAMAPSIQARGDDIGHVSLLIGDAVVVHADGSSAPLTRGTALRVGDRIETASNGHVHLRFVDNGAVSVRPGSVLEVQAYRYDARQPSSNEVRLKLERGAGRAISGAATSIDKSRFRMNTPIAAIGVKGTDFVVEADAERVLALVAEGAIVVTPYGESCLVAGLGPCSGQELTANMGRLAAEVRQGDSATRFVRSNDAAAGAGMVVIREAEDGRREVLALDSARISGLSAAEPTASQLQRGNDRSAADLLTVAAVMVPDLNRPSAVDGQLAWGRWAITPAQGDGLTMPFAIARLDRHVTVADAEAGLFRRNQASGPIFSSFTQGKVEFKLTRAAATFETASGLEAAFVRAGNLTVDFQRQTFATALDLASASGATGQLRMGGELRSDGLFSVIDQQQKVAGALSTDGREAGYTFETGSLGSLFRGRTLWRSGP